jgi:hypothetical protein
MQTRSIHWLVGRSMDTAIWDPSQALCVRDPFPTFLSLAEEITVESNECLSAT